MFTLRHDVYQIPLYSQSACTRGKAVDRCCGGQYCPWCDGTRQLVCDAIQYMDEALCINMVRHRNIKPENTSIIRTKIVFLTVWVKANQGKIILSSLKQSANVSKKINHCFLFKRTVEAFPSHHLWFYILILRLVSNRDMEARSSWKATSGIKLGRKAVSQSNSRTSSCYAFVLC